MKTLKILFFLTTLLCGTFLNAQWGKGDKIKGNGEVTSITRSVATYNGVSVKGSMDVVLTQGREGNLSLKGESNLLEYIETNISDDILTIKVKDGYRLKTTRPLIISVPVEEIELVALAGSGDVTSSDTIKANELEVALAGSGDMDLDIAATTTKVKIAGSGDINLNGNTNVLGVAVAGSGDFNGSKLKSKDVSAAISGSGTAKVYCTGNLKGRVSGSGDIIYSGNPETTDSKVSGSGRIKS